MRLEMVNEMQIEILNGGETLFHCKFKDFGIWKFNFKDFGVIWN
jgi:hypothetical protein